MGSLQVEEEAEAETKRRTESWNVGVRSHLSPGDLTSRR